MVIVGQRLKDTLRAFVNSVSQAGPTDQIARWDRQICPHVVGLDRGQAEFMTKRIAQVSKTVGISTGRRSCSTLLEIVFTPDAGALAGAVAGGFATDNWHIRAALRDFADDTKPVRWISLSDDCGGGCHLPNTRLTKATSPTLRAMIVIVDTGKIAGFKIGELSDYIALVTLSNPSLSSDPPAQSVLSLFKERRPGLNDSLTEFDFSFLAGLYLSRNELGSQSQRSSIVARMAKTLRNPPPAPPAIPK